VNFEVEDNMIASSDMEANLTPEQQKAFNQLLKDYDAAKKAHVPKFTGNISRKIAVQLIVDGWRKSSN
jgi:hypothetical protein